MKGSYGYLWQRFWQDLPDSQGAAFWDAEPARAAAAHLELFEPHFDPALPLVDLGCGNGTQTRYLAQRFPTVVAVDIAAAAIEAARQLNAAPNIEYQVLDVLAADQVEALRERLGDVNIYMRGVLHQLAPADRYTCARSLARLTGTRGCVFAQELTPAAHRTIGEILATSPAEARPKLHRLARYFPMGQPEQRSGEADMTVPLGRAGLAVLAEGELGIHTTERLEDGTQLVLGARYIVATSRR
jgi:SAM-dependent methyltransferase